MGRDSSSALMEERGRWIGCYDKWSRLLPGVTMELQCNLHLLRPFAIIRCNWDSWHCTTPILAQKYQGVKAHPLITAATDQSSRTLCSSSTSTETRSSLHCYVCKITSAQTSFFKLTFKGRHKHTHARTHPHPHTQEQVLFIPSEWK